MSKKIKNMGSTKFERFLKYIEKVEKETITKVDMFGWSNPKNLKRQPQPQNKKLDGSKTTKRSR